MALFKYTQLRCRTVDAQQKGYIVTVNPHTRPEPTIAPVVALLLRYTANYGVKNKLLCLLRGSNDALVTDV
jgi:hypothetical protein